jgi:leucyl-tRNA synthetase
MKMAYVHYFLHSNLHQKDAYTNYYSFCTSAKESNYKKDYQNNVFESQKDNRQKISHIEAKHKQKIAELSK